MSNLVTIDFHGSDIIAIEKDGEVLVPMKRICENLSLNWEPQRQRISRDSVLSQATRMIEVPTKGGTQQLLTIHLKFLNGFLFGIDDSRISDPDIKTKVILYKQECYDVIYEHFHPKPNSTEISTQDAIFSSLRDIAKIHGDEITETKRDLIALEKDIAMAFKMQQERLHTQAIKIAVLENTVSFYNEQYRANAYNQTAQISQSASKTTLNNSYITLKDAKTNEYLKPRIDAFSKMFGYYILSHKLRIWVLARESNIKKIGNLNAYPYQLVLDFFNPIHNKELAKIIDFSKFKELKSM